MRDARPNPEKVAGIEALLRQTELEFNNLERAGTELVEAEADFEDARAQLGGNGETVEQEKVEAVLEDTEEQFAGNAGIAGLKPNNLDRAREILEPLADAQLRRRELQQRLKLAGVPPDTSELGQYRDGVEACGLGWRRVRRLRPAPPRRGPGL